MKDAGNFLYIVESLEYVFTAITIGKLDRYKGRSHVSEARK